MAKLFHVLVVTLMVVVITCGQDCCPEGSWGELLRKDGDPVYKDKGVVERVSRESDSEETSSSEEEEQTSSVEDELDGDIGSSSGFNIYRVGNGSRCIVWNYGISGFNEGRTRELTDLIASKGFTVLIPDYYRGDTGEKYFMTGQLGKFIKKHTIWEKLEKDWDAVLPYAEEHGCKTFGAIGTCWGSYMVVRMAAHPKMLAGVSMHPSHSPIMEQLGESEDDILGEIQEKSKQVFMPSAQDHVNVKPGGLGESVLGDRLEIVEFPDMRHGWTTRGDLSEEAVKRDVAKAIELTVEHFEKYLK